MYQDFRYYRPDDTDLIVAKTTDQGPFAEDLFYLVFKGEHYWSVPGSQAERVFTWLNGSDKIDWKQSILASCSVENATFVLWRKEGPPVLSESRRQELKARFIDLLQRNSEFSSEKIEQLFDDLRARYSESHRGYHTLQHISHCLWELDHVETPNLNRDEIELAIWYHDAIYKISSKQNEEQSAELMKTDLKGVRLDLKSVYSLILASRHLAGGAPRSPEIDLFLDIDLSVLGQQELDYAIYKSQVREEYKSVSAIRYALGRKKVLLHFLGSTIYRTPSFQQRYEQQAKLNLKSELKTYRWFPPYSFL